MWAREQKGIGQRVEISHIQASMWIQHWGIGNAFLKQMDDWPRFDRDNAASSIANWYRCADDRWIMLSITDAERDWPKFCEAMGLQELIDDERFHSIVARAENCQALIALLDALFASEPLAEWERRLRTQPDLIFDRVQWVGIFWRTRRWRRTSTSLRWTTRATGRSRT